MSEHVLEAARSDSVSAAIQFTAISKDYRSLRPLRIRHVAVAVGERVALIGLDDGASQTVLDLIAGATIPDEGEVHILGRSTREVQSPDEWLGFLDAIGLVTPRAVLLESLSVMQNVALALTVRLDPPSAEDAAVAEALAEETGLSKDTFAQAASDLGPAARLRVRLARALALRPSVLAVEHPTDGLSDAESATFASDLARIASTRRLGVLVLTADRRFAARACHRTLQVRPATGEVDEPRAWRWPIWPGGTRCDP